MPEPIADESVLLDVVARQTLHAGRIQSFVRESFHYNGEELAREFVAHPGAVAVVALDEHDRVMVIKQYRHPIRSRDWEIPAGLLDQPGERLLTAARRELAEEVDLEAAEWSVLLDMATSPGGSDEHVRIYLARALSAISHSFVREQEEADIELRWAGLDDLVDAIHDGRLRNSILIAAVFATASARSRGWGSLRAAAEDDVWLKAE